jgi:hypothetical protein
MTTPPDHARSDHPQPGSDEADPDKETSPAGISGELEEKAEELGASTGPGNSPTQRRGSDIERDPDSPGATIDSPEPAEPNEPA